MTTMITIRTVGAIFRTWRVLFVGSVIAAVGSAIGAWSLQPVRYDVSVVADVMRDGAVQTEAYAYDQYYRLQADKQFAETIAHWLRTARVVDDILHQAGALPPATLRKKERFFTAQRVSSQSVVITFRVPTVAAGTRIATAIDTQLNRRASALNNGAQADWFAVTVDAPVITSAQKSLRLFAGVGLFGGIGIGIVAVFVAHALRAQSPRRRR